MRKLIYMVTCVVFAALFFSCVPETSVRKVSTATPTVMSAERLERIDAMINQAVDSGWIAGATALILHDGDVVYNKAFGKGNLTTGADMETNSIFRIASQTKAIASVAVMILFEQGKFLLDDPVSKYIPEFAHPSVLENVRMKDTTWTAVPAKREITIRDLLTHTSGIDYPSIGSENMKAIYAKAGIIPGFGTDKAKLGDMMKKLGKLPLAHQPGERFTYGLNVDVLGYLVEVVSGESLDSFLRKNIFEPLGMNDTYFYLPEEKFDRLVTVSSFDKDGKLNALEGELATYPMIKGTYFSGGAGLSSTTEDYGIFLQMLLNKGVGNGTRILSRRTVELMTCNQIGEINLGADKFGLGFEITTERGQSLLGVSQGSFSWGGYFGTTYWVDPAEKLVCQLYMQQLPLTHSEIQNKFRVLVYQALNN